jgi:hypothetical protein
MQSVAEVVLKYKGAIHGKTTKDDVANPEVLSVTMELWRALKVCVLFPALHKKKFHTVTCSPALH